MENKDPRNQRRILSKDTDQNRPSRNSLTAASNHPQRDNIADPCIQALHYTASNNHQRKKSKVYLNIQGHWGYKIKGVEGTGAPPRASSIRGDLVITPKHVEETRF